MIAVIIYGGHISFEKKSPNQTPIACKSSDHMNWNYTYLDFFKDQNESSAMFNTI